MHGPISGSGRERGSRRRMSSFNGGSKLRKQNHEPLTTMEEVPERLKEQAEALFETGEAIKVAVSTDLRFDGTYGKDWLLVTNKRLIAFNQNGAIGHHMREVPLTSVEDIEILEMYGNNILKVSTADNAFELSRYSKRLTPKFNLAVSELEVLVPQKERDADGRRRGRRGFGPNGMPSGKNKGRCEKCDQPIPSWSGVCVNCVQKGKLIFRLIKYSVPLLYVVVPAFLIMMVIRFVDLYPAILNRDIIDRILTPVDQAVEAGVPIPESDWGTLARRGQFLKRIVRQYAGWWKFRASGRAHFADGRG